MEEKLLTAFLSAVGALGVYFIGALVQHGRNKQKFETLTNDVEGLKAQHVRRTDLDNELLEIHRRIDLHSKESDSRDRATQLLLSDIKSDLKELKGFIRGKFGANAASHGEE